MNQVKDKTFMFTGTLSVTRDEAKSVVEELGGIAGLSISKGTDYLVCGADQVGKSNKWEKAGLLGITRVDEDYFWDLVKEAKAEGESEDEVIAHLEGDDFTDEQWEVIAAKCPNLKIMTADQFERLMMALLPSYESPVKLEKLVKEYNIKALPSSICKFCGETIPYSIHTRTHVYYCFKCHQDSDQKEHRCIWFDPGVKQGYYMCKICGDFTKMKGRHFLDQRDWIRNELYGNSVEYLADERRDAEARQEVRQRVEKMLEGVHICTEFERDEEMVAARGIWLKCKVCGKLKFVGMDEFEAYRRKRSEQSLTK